MPFITVQRVSSMPIGRQMKYQPESIRHQIFVEQFSLEGIKVACENFYGQPPASCDVLYSLQGPSCRNTNQLDDGRVIYVRFLWTDKEEE